VNQQKAVLSTATVLVVDDDPGTVTTFAYVLKTKGCRVITASNGGDAIRQVDRAVPDLVLCDLSLPDISGIDVCRALRKRSVAAAFVIVTGFASASNAFEAGHCGATGFIEKPVDIDDLVAVVEEQLREHHGKTPPRGYEAQMARITHVIERDYADPRLSVSTVARHVGLSKQHVCRVIKTQHHVRFADFVRNKRISESQRLLADSRWSVKEIAFRVGFRSASQFARTFRKTVGISPSVYQRQQTRTRNL
jgi:two-component system, response regulator YesN